MATLQEQGAADFDLVAWFMAYAPAATPDAETARLRDGIQRALAGPEVVAKLAELGVEPQALPARELVSFNQQ